ncbi:MAG: D-tyrosyl-tRNA(Tyr) deacylase [Saprospiraceae bacterium]|nr:D-tyrosyl-tRNA(Tyr) deacylase [Saprospiraceae bacterium]
MRALIQLVSEASVKVDGNIVGAIGPGLLILLGVADDDTQEDLEWLARKIVQMRIFPDAEGKMNAALSDIEGRMLVVSQFTLHASTKKGNRPSYIRAARPELAIPLYEAFVRELESLSGTKVETGVFGALMDVSLLNKGPVTIWMDSKNKE